MIPAMMVAQLVAGQTQDDRAVDSVDLSVHASVDQEGRETRKLSRTRPSSPPR